MGLLEDLSVEEGRGSEEPAVGRQHAVDDDFVFFLDTNLHRMPLISDRPTSLLLARELSVDSNYSEKLKSFGK